MNSSGEDIKILLIEDDAAIRLLVTAILTKSGYQVRAAALGQEGLRMFYEQQPDLVLLDVMLPDLNGWQICSQLRNLSNVPIIMLTALTQDHQIVKSLDLGAVDHMTKPFSPRILRARISAALRRSKEAAAEEMPMVYDDGYLTIDVARRQVLVRQQPLKLSITEYKLLICLFENAGTVLTYEQILDDVWGWEFRESVQYVHVYLSKLRQKLEADPGEPHYLLTERQVGYRFVKKELF